jgi:hypothetical protein
MEAARRAMELDGLAWVFEVDSGMVHIEQRLPARDVWMLVTAQYPYSIILHIDVSEAIPIEVVYE